MPLALMVMFVVALLGTALWQYSMTDNIQVSYYDKKLQAHYIARAGADSVAQHIRKNPDIAGTLISTKSNPVVFGKGTYEVEVSGTISNVIIVSTGNVSGVTDSVTVVLSYGGGGGGPSLGNIPPTPTRDGVGVVDAGMDKAWIDPGKSKNGKIIENDGAAEDQNGNLQKVIFEAKVNVWLNTGPSILKSSEMYFLNAPLSLEIYQGTVLQLYADLLVFKGEIYLRTQGNTDGRLCLFVSNGIEGSKIPGGDPNKLYGIVYFENGVMLGSDEIIEPGAYYFPNGTCLSGQANSLIKPSPYGEQWN